MSRSISPELIPQRLAALEERERVRVLYACESGSRAWGFASTDSDYDVRFLYIRRPDWYMSINVNKRRDVIEEPIADQLDVNGWDLMKALILYRNSNPPLFEWLGSPIVYLDRMDLAQRLRELAPAYYSPKAAGYHYLSMARNTWKAYLRSETVRAKKYFYALRPLLAVRWLERGLGVVPTEFATLVGRVVEEPPLREAIAELIDRKRAGTELGEEPRHPVLHPFIEEELNRLEPLAASLPVEKGPVNRLNALFREMMLSA